MVGLYDTDVRKRENSYRILIVKPELKAPSFKDLGVDDSIVY